MQNHTVVRIVKTIHTIIYLIMVAAIFYTLYAAITGTYDRLLTLSLVLLAAEVIVFAGNGMRCPFTDLAKKYGDPRGYVGDTFFPEACTKHTFWFFGSLLCISLVLLALNFLHVRS
ncbi:MAG: hypothetical protein WCS85_02385 [Candidatus Peribacteraceae bacterium]|jgi:hypothetical protein